MFSSTDKSHKENSRVFYHNDLDIHIDLRRMGDYQVTKSLNILERMEKLEAGDIANYDENRRVGHYWLRNPNLYAKEESQEILKSWDVLKEVLQNPICQSAKNLLMIGIGGSALGPQFLVDALQKVQSEKKVYFLDNTDPDGIDRILLNLDLEQSIFAVLSKSGSTKETRNAMLETISFCEVHNISFAQKAIAVTVKDSKLDKKAHKDGWLGSLPLWNWVGGRTSATGMVGLLPLAFLGLDWREFLKGAALMDTWTRSKDERENPALHLASSWLIATEGSGKRAMVVLPYKDRLLLLGRYLQQLIMESLGKKYNLAGDAVHQGLTVYGNKGSTDQHAYIQQLREGPDDFFVTFVATLEQRVGKSIEVEEGVTSGDYLLGFLIGTRNALSEENRRSMTLILPKVDEKRMGAIIALYERAVGMYAEMIGINAYHQPGVEAGKKAAGIALDLQRRILAGTATDEDLSSDDGELIKLSLQRNGRL